MIQLKTLLSHYVFLQNNRQHLKKHELKHELFTVFSGLIGN